MKSFYIFLAISCFAVPQRNTTTTEIPRITTDNEISNVDRFDKKSRIINGSPILDARSFPSYASIRRLGHHLCGGVILDESRILTAAHCEIKQFDTVIVGGIKRDGSDKQQELRIKYSEHSIRNHPYYKLGLLENDLTVVELESALNFTSNVQPIKIGSEEEFQKIKNGITDCQLVGHGYIDGHNSVLDQLQVANQVFSTEKSCQNYKINSSHCFVTKSELGNSQACQGDSGGPLYCDVGNVKKLFGIVSFVRAFSCDKGFTGFTMPMRYNSFIDDTYPYGNGYPSVKLQLTLIFIFIALI